MTRFRNTLLALVVVSSGCDGTAPTGPGTEGGAQAIIVSNPVVDAPPSAGAAYVSVPPASFGGATSATIEHRDGSVATVVPVDGGFDPVAVPAAAGDTLEIRMTLDGGGTLVRSVTVPVRRPPRVVRTYPARGRRDVAVNSVIAVVFSEPMDPGTVQDSTVRLLKDGVAVHGTVQAAVASKVGVEFAPDEPLEPDATYRLVLDASLRDLAGDALEATEPIEFTTHGEGGTGPLTILTRTTGQLDPDGYELFVDGRVAANLAPTDSIELAGVGAGGHQVLLGGLRSNCLVKGGLFRQVQITTSGGARAEFDVTCPAIGTLQVTTTGAGADDAGYGVRVNGSFVGDIEPNGTFPLSGLDYGLNIVELTGMRGNCGDPGSARRFMTFAVGDASPVAAFAIHCAPDFVPQGVLAFASGSSGSGPAAIVIANADGSGRLQVTDDQTRNRNPAWSPDGSRLAFLREVGTSVDLYLVDADGGNLEPRVAGFFEFLNSVAWLPDGRIMLKGTTAEGESGLFAVDADGSDAPAVILPGFGLIAWSPSGAQFVRLDGSNLAVFDGSAVLGQQFQTYPNSAYWWGPFWTFEEGTFAGVGCRESLPVMDPATELGYCRSYHLDLIRADGSGRTFLSLPEPITSPAWSFDGSTIAFTRCGGGDCRGIGYMRAGGGGSTVTIPDGFDPAWRP